MLHNNKVLVRNRKGTENSLSLVTFNINNIVKIIQNLDPIKLMAMILSASA